MDSVGAGPGRASGSAEVGLSSSRDYADAEEAALKQALEESLSNTNSPAGKFVASILQDGGGGGGGAASRRAVRAGAC